MSVLSVFRSPRSGRRQVNGPDRRWISSAVAVALVALVAGAALAPEGSAAAAGTPTASGVLPPSQTPNGYSLADMSRLTAPFTASGNNAAFFPSTPFQILYTAQTQAIVPDCVTFVKRCGLTVTQAAGTVSNSFTVNAGTIFYVPV